MKRQVLLDLTQSVTVLRYPYDIYIYYSYGRISFCKVKKCEILSGLGGTGVLINNYFLTRISALVKEMGGNVFRNYEF